MCRRSSSSTALKRRGRGTSSLYSLYSRIPRWTMVLPYVDSTVNSAGQCILFRRVKRYLLFEANRGYGGHGLRASCMDYPQTILTIQSDYPNYPNYPDYPNYPNTTQTIAETRNHSVTGIF